jgi:hypothetical protein
MMELLKFTLVIFALLGLGNVIYAYLTGEID